MSFRFRKAAIAVITVANGLCVSTAWAQLSVNVQNTGSNTANGRDQSYQVVSDTTGEGGSGPAYVITNLPNGWASIPGAQWIGPAPDQSNATRPGNQFAGDVRFRTTFMLSGADPSKVTLDFTMLADDNVEVTLNGNYIFLPEDAQYRTMFATPVKYTLDYGFQTGVNTLEFLVHNTGGGPTGLNVSYAINDAKPPVTGGGGGSDFYPDITPPRQYSQLAAPEPVDGATGQYYDVFLDLNLGGPVGLAFERYYASQLSATGYSTALGTNWMSNFDLGVKVSGISAQVLLFTGKVLKFGKTGTDWGLVSPTDTPYTLSQSSSGFSLQNPYSGLHYNFSTAGVLTMVIDRSGNAIVLTQGPNGPTQASWGPYSLTFTYIGKQLTAVRDQAGREVRFGYTGTLLTSFTDVTQQVYTYSYTSAGKLTGLMTKKQFPLGETPTTQTYDAVGRVISQADSNNNVVTFAYDGHGGTRITDPSSQVTTQANDANGSIGQLSDPLGGAAKFTYDGSNRRTSITDRSGNTVSYSYDPVSGRMASRTDPLGNKTGFTFAPQSQLGATFYNLAAIAHADGTKTAFAYNGQGQVTSATLRDGSVRGYAYDQAGRETSTTLANGARTAFTYNTDFTIATMQDALGNKTSYSYDANSRLSKLTDPNGSVVSFTYNPRGAVTSYTNETGATVAASYDADGRLSQRTNAYGGRVGYARTAAGNLASFTDALGNGRQFGYDSMLRPTSYTNALGQTLRLTRDAAGHLLSILDDSGKRAMFTYKPEGQRASFQDALGRTWTYGIDASGRRSSITTPLGNKTAFAYDKLGRMASVTDALGQAATVQYDAMGRPVQLSLPGGLTTKIARNSLGAATAIADPIGNVWTRDYDLLGRLVKRTDPVGNVMSYSYTGTRLSGAATPAGTLAIAVDAAGSVTQRGYSDGTTLNYTYDAAGRLAGADGVALQRDVAGQVTASNGISVGRDALGRVTSLSYADGKAVGYSYSAAGKLSQVSDWTGAVTTFGYDAAGQMIFMQRANGVGSTYTYDGDGRMTQTVTGSAAGSIASINLTRDANGRITAADRNLPLAPTVPDSAQSYSYDAASQLATATSDAVGRVTAQDNRTYTWDGASRLTSFSDAGSPVSMTYDALGEIASMTSGGTTRNFVFDYALKLPALSVVQQGGADLRYYVYLPNGKLLYSVEAADNSHKFYHFDEAGNTAFLTDDGANVTDSYAITPYGESVDHPGTSDNPFTFQGEYGVIQEAAGLYYMRSRHYDAGTARFLSRDTVSVTDPRGVAPYGYARGNPLSFSDPLGNGWFDGVSNFFASVGAKIHDTFFPPETPAVQPVDNSSSDASTAEYVAPQQPVQDTVDNAPVNSDIAGSNSTYMNDQQATLDPSSYLIDTSALAAATQPALAPAAADSAALSCGNSGVISNDGGSVVSHDGGTVISNDGGSVVSHDGGTLITNDGGGVVSHDGGTLITNDGGGVVSHDGGSLITNDGGTFTGRFGPSY